MKRVLLVLAVASTSLCLPSAAGAAVPIKAVPDRTQAHVGRLVGEASAPPGVVRTARPGEGLSQRPAVRRSVPGPIGLSTIARSLRQGDVGLALALTDRLVRRILTLGRAWLSGAAQGFGREA